MQNVDASRNYPRISLIAALGKNRVIGRNNELIWHIPDDLKRFKELTSGHPVIMGRKTWESLPEKFRPLPGRTNIVITRDAEYQLPAGVILAQTFPEALSRAKDVPGAEEIFIIGGGQVYEAAIPFATNLYLTLIDDEQPGDTRFPAYEDQFTRIVSEETRESNGISYSWINLER